jgi:hypothetical protein
LWLGEGSSGRLDGGSGARSDVEKKAQD